LLHVTPQKTGADAISAVLADPLRRIDPLKALADQRARPLVGPALARVPVPLTPLPPALLPGAPQREAQFYVELGLTCEALREFSSAVAAFRKATEIQPDLRAAWLKLAELLTRLRINAEAASARAQAQALSAQAPPAHTERPAPSQALSSAKLERQTLAWAKRIRESPPESSGVTLREHLRREPTDVAALRVLANIGASKGMHVAAQHLLERALALAPFHPQLRMEYVGLLMAQSNAAPALPIIESLIADDPGNLDHRASQAICLSNIGEFGRAIAIFESLRDKVAADPNLMVSYAYALRYAGRAADGARVCRECIALAPGMGRAWWALADSRREKFTQADIETMRSQLDNAGVPPAERYHLHYALGHALEQAADYAGSFSHYASGAALKRAELHYDPAHNAREMARQRSFFTAARLAAGAAHGNPDPAPIFIFGLPRVGSTLIEQILASHSAVEGTQELFEIADIAADIGMVYGFAERSLYPERIEMLSPEEIAAFGARYIDRTRKFRRTTRPFFIDKMPGNWTYLGLIQIILPNAKFIDARRHPVASGFAAFKQLFGSGMDFSYNLAEFGGYYNEYLRSMAHFDHVLPGRVHRVIYENLVTDTEAEIRRLLAYCGLPFEPACLRFWETQRAVATPSAEQVRRPMSITAKDQWRNYEPWLGPLKAALNVPGVPPWNPAA
jgi:cytochrome c-type biogenesis protein CcmH/NrfG